ncbi:hypothetical protein Shyhy02_77600 [Streptomyces hygroscopicus subsp. hygroscopicus]|nr:hypothetical protein Shyhy02_77600 [Streptomyces hygroscopicus subsp. hygroscopicus]
MWRGLAPLPRLPEQLVQARRHRWGYPDVPDLNAVREAMVRIASIDNLAKRVADETIPAWRGTAEGLPACKG